MKKESLQTYTKHVEQLLGNNLQYLESASLKHSKFLTLGGNSQYQELQSVAQIAGRFRLAEKSLASLPADSRFELTLGGRLAINMSTGVLENAGICLHRHFNIPYIPGSALKGIARHQAWCEWREAAEEQQQAIDAAAIRVFGSSLQGQGGGEENQRGQICFFDALPANDKWRLAVDVLTPHGGNDYTPPVPCFFLTVEQGACFAFLLHKLARNTAQEDLARAENWLRKGLVQSGAGAKGIAGYGWFQDGQTNAPIELKLASPGFFSGATQYGDGAEKDCQLRTSSLRGMLRWWWRALYRDYLPETVAKVDKDNKEQKSPLKELEDFFWGSTESSGLIQLQLSPGPENPTVRLFSYKNRYDLESQFARTHNIDPRNNGLLYLAYGMDEKSKEEIQQRHYLEAGGVWRLRLLLRNNLSSYAYPNEKEKKMEFSQQEVLDQAHAALSLLSRYGGVGAKCRKGFGSLNWKEALGLKSCQQIAEKTCHQLGVPATGLAAPYGLQSAIREEVEVKCNDPWKVLDSIGLAVRGLTQSEEYKHNEKKVVLGLPRQIHGPRKDPMKHQNAQSHKPPKHLTPALKEANQGKQSRFASPIWIHLEDAGSKYQVRLTAFPSDQLYENEETSKKLLKELVLAIKARLENVRSQPNRRSSYTPQPSAVVAQNSLAGRKAGDKVQAVLLEEKTKKGGWKVNMTGSDAIGPIVNSAEVPESAAVGDEIMVRIYNASENPSFKYAKGDQ